MKWDNHNQWDKGNFWDRPDQPFIVGGGTMMIFQLIINFARLSRDAFLAKAQNIKVALTSEPALTLLPEPWAVNIPTRVQLAAAYKSFEDAFDAAQNGGKLERDARDQERIKLTALFKECAPYFESVARQANDITILDATGYDRAHAPEPTPQPPAAPVMKVRQGKVSGVLVASGKRPEGAVIFETQRCTGDPSIEANWNSTVQTTGCRHIELPGCTPGLLYYVRTRARGHGGAGPWSVATSLMVI